MSVKQNIFERVLTNSFSIDEFLTFSKELLVNLQIVAPKNHIKVFNNFSFHINGYTHVANYFGKDEKKVAIFAIELKKGEAVERARSIQRNFVKKLLESGNVDAAIVAFYTVGETKWRLSFVRMDFEFAKGKVTENLTPAKRYSYLVGIGEPCHTAKDRLFPIFNNDDLNPSIDDLEEAFSVEKVTDEFFRQYCEKYHELRELLEKSEDFMIEANLHHFSSEQFAKKLMGQIVFLYFIQKKGWLGVDALPRTMTEKEFKDALFSRGAKSREIVPIVYIKSSEDEYRLNSEGLHSLKDNEEEILASCVKGQPWGKGIKDFLRKLFTSCEIKNKNYFNEYLEPLFYKALNTNRGENAYFPQFHCRIPFLNGGLFEQLDNYEWEHNNFNLPNSVFSNVKEKGRYADGILDVFDRYNFTMNEDEPMEKEVAIDPEMLGKIFENLLDIKDRKSKGAFYTPREIVHYMCQESLTNYLVNETGLQYEDIKDFILYGEIMKDEDTVKEVREGNGGMFISSNIFDLKSGVNRLKNIDDALASVRVADPAVGSGAFPLGMINEIIRARETISGYYGITMNDYQKKIMYALERNPYSLKIHAIKNCIFAVDIEPSAVDITKLRLWLSLVIEDEVNPNASSYDEFLSGHKDPSPLPNLDCNIRCGNSLIDELDGIELINKSKLIGNDKEVSSIDINQHQFEVLLNELINAQEKLFFIKEHTEKEELKQRIQSLTDQIIYNQLGGTSSETKQKYENHKNDASLPYMLWQLEFARVFKEKGGFDIVIGNPPYLESRNSNFSDVLKNLLQKQVQRDYGKNSKCIPRGADLLIYFFELSLKLIKPNGVNVFITQNSWLDTEYGASFQDYLLQKTNILGIVDSDFIYFENADINTIITIFEGKNGCNKNIVFARAHKSLANYSLSLNVTQFIENDDADINVFSPNDPLIRDLKWGTLFACHPKMLKIISKLNSQGKKIDSIKNGIFSIGQGLNLTKSCIVNMNIIESLVLPRDAYVPFMTNTETGYYYWQNSDNYLIYKSKLNADQKTKLRNLGYDYFDDTKSNKEPPALILPRGIGARHFCSYNACNGFSASAVDVYSSVGNAPTDEIIRLWLFFNSSLCWLIREISGRKNLGGGMLKAEAVDLKSINSYLEIFITPDIRRVFENSMDYFAENVSLEIEKSYHKFIDNIIYDYLDFSNEERQFVQLQLISKSTTRYSKSATKR